MNKINSKFLFLLSIFLIFWSASGKAEYKGEILPAETRTGAITNDNLMDTFTFQGEEGQLAIIKIAGYDKYISLYGPDGTLLKSASFMDGIRDFKLPLSGTYTLVVEGDPGGYDLSLLLIPGPTPTTYTLDINISPSEGGLVVGEGIDCPEGSCQKSFEEGTSVTLTATPNDGYIFDHWDGCDETSDNLCSLEMNTNRTVTAYFKAANNPPNPPENPDPADGATDIPYESIRFSWQASDPDNDPLIYKFYLGPQIEGSCQLELLDDNLAINQYEIDHLSPETTYCWKVEVCDQETCSSGPIWTFKTAPREIISGPDLIISKLVTPSYWHTKWTCRVNLIIKNQGELDTQNSFKLRVKVQSKDDPNMVFNLAEKEIDNLRINQRKLVRFRFKLPQGIDLGAYTLYVTIDADHEISETNEENNLVQKQIIIR